MKYYIKESTASKEYQISSIDPTKPHAGKGWPWSILIHASPNFRPLTTDIVTTSDHHRRHPPPLPPPPPPPTPSILVYAQDQNEFKFCPSTITPDL